MSDPGFTLQTLVAALGWTLLDFLWQGALIGLLYLLARVVIGERRLPLRLAIGNLALIAFAVAPVLTLTRRLLGSDSADGVDAVAQAVLPGLQSFTVVGQSSDGPGAEAWMPWLVAAWLAGVALLAGRGLLRWRTTRQLCAAATPLSGDWTPRIDRLHRQLAVRLQVLVRESAQVAAPILIGWLKPVILLPLGLSTRLPVDQIEVILAHELVHVRRLDVWANAAQIVLETLLFYHPVVAWLGRCVRQDRELCCDAAVAESGLDRLTYARALLALAEDHRRPTVPTAMALAATGGVLLNRVEHLLGVSPRAQARFEGLAPAAVLAIGIALLAVPTSSQWLQQRALRWQPMLTSQPSIAHLAPLLELAVRDVEFARPAVGPTLAGDAVEARVAPSAGLVPPVAARSATAMIEPPPLPEASTGLPVVDLAPPAAAVAVPSAITPRLQPVQAEPLRILRREAPYYPRSALTRGIEGSAALSFSIDAEGRPVDIQVESASQQMFASAAIAALRHWRFATDSGGGRQQQHFDFSLSGDADTSTAGGCQLTTGSRICRPTP